MGSHFVMHYVYIVYAFVCFVYALRLLSLQFCHAEMEIMFLKNLNGGIVYVYTKMISYRAQGLNVYIKLITGWLCDEMYITSKPHLGLIIRLHGFKVAQLDTIDNCKTYRNDFFVKASIH